MKPTGGNENREVQAKMDDSEQLEATRKYVANLGSHGDVAPVPFTKPLEHIGRYRIENVLGKGGFGVVYLAQDEELNRRVAVKVPHAKLILKPEDVEAYLAEARTVANLEHPGIVPMHDVGSTKDFPCYVVSRYIHGSDLATKIKQRRFQYREAAELVATVADALHYAHRQGIVHRDVKPGNILIGNDGKPYVVDFGLALREENIGKGPKFAGTPSYMSPEQARGEGHRVDGRSDIFSLGVVFYELLTGRRPFKADSQAELLEQITTLEARPPRQLDDSIPKELERICLKSLSKRASERYTTARDFAEELRHLLGEQLGSFVTGGGSPSKTPAAQPLSNLAGSGKSAAPTSDSRPIMIVPKGLRSFDAHDSDFFLELLPGPRDRDGVPDSIRFWKTRIEEKDAEKTFTVGLICGPSGCGKSSLVKAGLLPRLSDDVIAVYVEASAEETETRLLNGLRKHCPALADNSGLKETLAAIRRGQCVPLNMKVIIVLDQFEQWLHANKEETNTELVQSLRQCDGERVQCIIMVRDDFWMAVIRFMRELEVRLVDGENSAAADLFDADHARKVLAAFGRAFHKLPENPGDTSKVQEEFLEQAVSGLAQEGKVICVRLALFAEMMKGKAWTPASLKAVGGMDGVGVTFLEETFSAATAPPEHRYHQKAARAVLKDLLPDSGTDIKGYMRSYAELLEASSYGSRPKDFDDLIRILDNEIRLITPTDPEGKAADNESVTQTEAGQRYFQLTHDFLVHSLRVWLTRKQKETRRGRAELRLADISATWNAWPENRHLPTLSEHVKIRLLTVRQQWTKPQRKLLAQAGRVHGIRVVFAALLLVAGLWSAFEVNGRWKAELVVGNIILGDAANVWTHIGDLAPYRRWARPMLLQIVNSDKTKPEEMLNASLALLEVTDVDSRRIEYLFKKMLDARPEDVLVIARFLQPYEAKLTDRLWRVIEAPSERRHRLRSATALALFEPGEARWRRWSAEIAGELVSVPAFESKSWTTSLRPVGSRLAGDLETILKDPRPARTSERSIAAAALAEYLAAEP